MGLGGERPLVPRARAGGGGWEGVVFYFLTFHKYREPHSGSPTIAPADFPPTPCLCSAPRHR